MGTGPLERAFFFTLGLGLVFEAEFRFFGVRFFAVLLEDAAGVMNGIVSRGHKVVKSSRF